MYVPCNQCRQCIGITSSSAEYSTGFTYFPEKKETKVKEEIV